MITTGTIGVSGTSVPKQQSNDIPKPILVLGNNYFLQHNRGDDFNTWIAQNFSSTGYCMPSITQDGTAWANDNLKVGVSYVNDGKDYSKFLNNNPMIFLEVLNQNKKSNANGRLKRSQWTHPPHRSGTLNRTNTNYGGGDVSPLFTEWDFTSTEPFVETLIEINPTGFYRGGGILPQRWVDFISIPQNQLRWQRGYGLTPTGNGADKVVNTFKQPIRFRFGYLAGDGRTVLLGKPSEELIFSPKWGYFEPQDDTYVYDFQLRFKR